MTTVDIIVILAAVAALAGLGWFFFGPRKASAAVLALSLIHISEPTRPY